MDGIKKYIKTQGCGPYRITDNELWRVYFGWKKWADSVRIVPSGVLLFDVVSYKKVKK